jgi:hexosaminidase
VDLKVIGGQGEPLKISATNAAGAGRMGVKKIPATGNADFTYIEPFVPESGRYIVEHRLRGVQTGRTATLEFKDHLAAGKRLTLENDAHPKYNGEQPHVVLNGVIGSDERYGDAEWLGFEGTDFKGTIEWDRPQRLKVATLRFFYAPGQWIYTPKRVKISTWDDETNDWKALDSKAVKAPDGKIAEVSLDLGSTITSKIKIEIDNHGKIEAGQQGAGNAAWLFVDEIRID